MWLEFRANWLINKKKVYFSRNRAKIETVRMEGIYIQNCWKIFLPVPVSDLVRNSDGRFSHDAAYREHNIIYLPGC